MVAKSPSERTLSVVLHPGEDGWTGAECPLIPECITRGRSREEALANVPEAIALCLETQEEEESWQRPKHFELVDVDAALAS